MSGTPKATTDEIEQRIREERQAVKAEREPIELPSEDELEQYLGQRLPELEQRGVPVEHECLNCDATFDHPVLPEETDGRT